MPRIRLDPAGLRAAGTRFIDASDGLAAATSSLGGLSLPAMPPGMADGYAGRLASAAGRLRVAADLDGRIGEELQLRAAAAEAADAPGEAVVARAGRKVQQAVTSVASVAQPGGAVALARITVDEDGAVVRSSSGLTLTMPELAGVPVSDDAPDRATVRAAAHAAEPGADPVPARGEARSIAPTAAVGGSVGADVHAAVGLDTHGATPGAERYLQGDPIDPAGGGAPDLRAAHHDGTGAPLPADMPDHTSDDRQAWACWMAGAAAHHGLPPTLPLMMALSRAGMRNMPAHHDGVGFFDIEPGRAYAPPGHGLPRDTRPDADWWRDHPDAQLDHVIQRLGAVSGGVREHALHDSAALGRWAHDAEPSADPQSYADAYDSAEQMVARCRHGAPPAPTEHAAGRSWLSIAEHQLGVREFGSTNTGPEVNRYLAAGGVPSGNPWCASFVTWSLAHAGHEMPGSGWAAVSTWVHAAQAGQHGLQVVDPAHARPGDIVAYDWGGDNDFGADGHIGFLDSAVGADGRFTAVEGNAGDAVSRMERSTSLGNVIFLRVNA